MLKEFIQTIKDKIEEHQLKKVERDFRTFKTFWFPPTEKVQLLAVTKNSFCFNQIKKPSLTVMLAVVDADPWFIQSIKDPPEDVQIAAVVKDPRTVLLIRNPTNYVKLISAPWSK